MESAQETCLHYKLPVPQGPLVHVENTDVIQLDGANCICPCVGGDRKTRKEGLVSEEKGPSLSSRQPAKGELFLLLSSQEGTIDIDLEHSLLFGMLHLSSLQSSVGHGVQFLF